MDFPEIQNNNEDEIQVDNVDGFGDILGDNQNPQMNNVNQGNMFDNFSQNNHYEQFENPVHKPTTDAFEFGGSDHGWNQQGGQNNYFDPVVDEEEEKRIQARRAEEDERRAKLIKLMNDEIKVKQEYRDKAREFLENQASLRAKNLSTRMEFNRGNETEFLQNRQAVKEGKKNPWEKVVENIEVKESEYKGTKDISRMRAVILTRKGDMMKMK